MYKIHLLIINYNYTRFLIESKHHIKKLKKSIKSLTIVDDQSTEDISILKQNFCNNLVITSYDKSENNYLNQLNAIEFGINKINNISSGDYLWVVDADDIPVLPKNLSYHLNQDFDILFFGRKERDKILIPKISHGFWVKNCFTSSLMFKYEFIKEKKVQIFSSSFHDIWFDVRICSFIFLNEIKFKLCYEVNNERLIHGMNDSLRIKRYSFKRILKILNTLYFSLRL